MAVTICSKECWAIRNPTPQIPLSLDDFPDEMLLEIFNHLSHLQLFKCAFINRRCRRILMDPRLLGPIAFLKFRYPDLTIIDEAVWKKYIDTDQYELSFHRDHELDWLALDQTLMRLFKRVIPFQKRFFRKYPKKNPGIAEDAGATILTIPRGISLQKMWGMATALCDRPGVSHCVPNILDFNEKTYTVLITNNVFKHTPWMSRVESTRFLTRLGMTLPSALDLYCLVIMRNIIAAVTEEKIWRMKEPKKVYLLNEGKEKNNALVISNLNAMVPAYISNTPCVWANYGPIGMIRL